MEYLDIYDENKNYLGKELRSIVHEKGLWHNTVHCWLYDSKGNIYFQIRAEEKTFYTTASGHVDAGETIKEAFGREIREEIGIEVAYEEAVLVDVVTWKMDKIKKDGSLFIDRAFANVNVLHYETDAYNFKFDINEVIGLVKVNALDALNLFKKGSDQIPAEIIAPDNSVTKRDVKFEEFLVNEHETALGKYGEVLNKVIELTQIAD